MTVLFTAAARSASSRITEGDLPPSSSATRLTPCAASSEMRLPARVEPVNEIMSTCGWRTSASPTVWPKPVTRLNTPLGRPAASITSARAKALNGATSEGLSTTVQPAASAGASLRAIWCSGIVPGRDRDDHADRLAHHQRVADALLELEVLHQLGVIGEVGDRQSDLDAVGELERHADLVRDGARDLVGARLEAGGYLGQEFGALLERGRGPRFERAARGQHGGIGVLVAAGRHPAHHLAGTRVVDIDRFLAGRCNPLAADVELVAHEHLDLLVEDCILAERPRYTARQDRTRRYIAWRNPRGPSCAAN